MQVNPTRSPELPQIKTTSSDVKTSGPDGPSTTIAIDNNLLQHDSSHQTHVNSAGSVPLDYMLDQRQSYPQHTQLAQSAGEPSTNILASGSSGLMTKPSVGSTEWHKMRRDNHKEVERRRRENINKGINELAKIVPDCDKHKGLILQRTVDYIKKLKDNEQHNIEKLTLEKLLTEQAIAELSATNKALKAELAQAWKEVEHWKRACGVGEETKE